jgi:hypothetical protein
MAVTSPLRCSPAVRSLGHPPIGTAPPRTSFLLVDVPLPWGRDIADDPTLAPIRDAIARAAARGEPWRLQGAVPAVGDDLRRAVAHRLPLGPYDAHRRHEVTVAPHDVIDAAVAMVDDREPPGAAETGEGELLVCTHGRRDACCGASGTALWKELAAAPELLPAGTRLVRTSHTGGHRFAPTAIHLPSGTSWAWLDAASAGAVVRRDVPFGMVADRYRGSCGLATSAEQVVERAVLGVMGWSWLDGRRTGSTVIDGDRRQVELAYTSANGNAGAWTAEVVVTGRTPVPDCGGPLDGAPKQEELLAVVPGTLACRPPTT